MPQYQAYLVFVIFGAVILAIAFNLLDMTLAALLGLSVMALLGIIHNTEVMRAVTVAQGALALLFGGMVVARVLAPTGIFEHIGTRFLLLTRGSGRRFLLYTTILTSLVCAILPNATAVILIAPIVIRVCRELKVDFVGPMILVAMLSNAAGLLTLVGDPATFLVGQAAGLGFMEYLRKVSLGGVLAILVVVPLMPVLLGEVWRVRRELPEGLAPTPIERPGFCLFAVLSMLLMVGLFLVGEYLPTPIVPPSAAIIGATLALLAVYTAKVEPLDNVFRDIDWKTLIFIFAMMCYVEEVTRTGAMGGLSRGMHGAFGSDLLLAGFALLAGIGLASGFLANIPVVAAAVLLTKGYFVLTQLVPEEAMGFGFTEWPDHTLPVFVAMMFGGTLGGNATLIGSSANLVAGGICAAQGSPVSFVRFLRYGVPVTVCQLLASAGYVWVLSKILT